MSNTPDHLVEVLCSLKFDSNQNEWDSTYFGRYHDKILKLGYTEKQEKKEVKLQIDMKTGNPNTNLKEGVVGFIFRDNVKKTAIIIGPHFISFHKLKPYTDWGDLMNNVLEPGLEMYKSMGLGKGLKEVQCTYINNMELTEGQKGVFDKFKILEPPSNAQETSINFQGNYEISDKIKATIKLNWNKVPKESNKKGIFFECSTFVKANGNSDYKQLAQEAHDAANLFYEQIKK